MMNDVFKTIGSPRTLGQEIVKMIESNNNERDAIRPKSVMVSPALVIRESSIRMGREGGAIEQDISSE